MTNMGMTNAERSRRFGSFALDLRRRELLKNGRKLKLQEQPFQVLAVLVEHPGEVVTREELQRAVWPENTFVDFDNSLNIAILKLRQTLADDRAKPRYIETVPRRGYRFIARLQETPALPPPADGISALRAPRQSRIRWKWGQMLCGVAACALAACCLLVRLPPKPELIDTIAIETGINPCIPGAGY